MNGLHVRIVGSAGRITLARPQALNALSRAMIAGMREALACWRDDARVRLVVIDGEGRSFCAGGDVAAMWHMAAAGDHARVRQFFAEEYRLNLAIARFPKPVVSFMQGHVMGGGVGIGCNAGLRVVTASTSMAMPEAGIGLVPDATGSWWLARAPGHFGEYLGLTGARMGLGDAIAAGFADLALPQEEWPALIARLAATADTGLIPRRPPPPPERAGGDFSAFAAADPGAITAALREAGDTDTLAMLAANSPLSVACTLRLIRAARTDQCIEDSVSREYRFTSRASTASDFLEGVRARLIERDNAPRWRHAGGEEAVAAMLALPEGGELLAADGAAAPGCCSSDTVA